MSLFWRIIALATVYSRQDAIQQVQQNPLGSIAYRHAFETSALPNLSCAGYVRELRTTTAHQQVAVIDTASAQRGGAPQKLQTFEQRLKAEPSFKVSNWEDFVRPLASLQMPCTRAQALPRMVDGSDFSILERSREACQHEPQPTKTTSRQNKETRCRRWTLHYGLSNWQLHPVASRSSRLFHSYHDAFRH